MKDGEDVTEAKRKKKNEEIKKRKKKGKRMERFPVGVVRVNPCTETRVIDGRGPMKGAK